MARKLYLISPPHPTGASWLINCFLALGIKVYRNNPKSMWVDQGDGTYVFHPGAAPLKRWFPILSAQEVFAFRQDVEVCWHHVWPKRQFKDAEIIYFIRDPRDSLLSLYRREKPEMSFSDFLAFPDHHSLINKVDTWALFNRLWLSHPGVTVFRFEDYKTDAAALLQRILQRAQITCSDSAVARAVAASTFEKARQAEEAYLSREDQDAAKSRFEIINRAGKIGAWQELAEEDAKSIREIEEKCREEMIRLGYLSSSSRRSQEATVFNETMPLHFLSAFDDVSLPRPESDREGRLCTALESFASTLTFDKLRRAQLTQDQIMHFTSRLAEYFTKSRKPVCVPLPEEAVTVMEEARP